MNTILRKSTALICLCHLLVHLLPTHAADIQWDGSGTGPFGLNSESWQNVDNWAPFGTIFQVHRVPGDGDTAMLLNPVADDVRLNANTAPIDGLIVSNSIGLDTNGFFLRIDNGGQGTTAIAGGAAIEVDPSPGGVLEFSTDNLFLSGGGQLMLNGGRTKVTGNTTIVSAGEVLSSPSAAGSIDFGGNVTLVNGSIHPIISGIDDIPTDVSFAPGITVKAQSNSRIHLQHNLEIDDGTAFQIQSGSALTVEGLTTIGPLGSLEFDGGTFNADGNVLVYDTASFIYTDHPSSNFNLADGSEFQAENFAQIEFQQGLTIRGDSTYSISGGSNLTAKSLNISHGKLLVQLNATSQISAGSINVGLSDDGSLELKLGATMTHTGNFDTNVGNFGNTFGEIIVSDGASYSSGTGRFFINSNGFLCALGGNQAGVVRVNGPLDVNGFVYVYENTAQADDPGGVLHVDAPMTITGGEIYLIRGAMTVDSISFSNSGLFHYTGGTLSVGVFTGNLTVPPGGTLAPGPVGFLTGANDTTIVGNYTQQGGSELVIEIGGLTMATEHDFVNVTGTALVDGDLQLELIDGFVPSMANTMTIFNANNLLGFFDNIGNGGRLSTLDGSGSFQVNYGINSQFDPTQIVLSNFLANSADTEPDGDIDGADFLALQRTNPTLIPLWESQFGNGAPLGASQAVPEPQSLALLLLALTCVSRRSLFLQHDIN